jgi:FixJ family two-component response regulator
VPTPLPTVAIVDDDLGTLKALGRLLRACHFEPVPYASAEAFLASPPLGTPVCLVLDIELGGMSGLELQRRLNAAGSTLPVIIVTGFEDQRVRDEACRLGCVAFLHKDSNADVVIGVIRALAARPRPAWVHLRNGP